MNDPNTTPTALGEGVDAVNAGLDSSADMRQIFSAHQIRFGARVGRYVIGREIGHGGMGIVYEADDPELGRKVAIKWLLGVPAADTATPTNRLLLEAQALAKLNHPNVVVVHDYGTHEGRVWLAMEYIAGTTLRRWMMERPRSLRAVLRVLEEVACGIEAAHAAGIVHRDLKPDNVMVGHDGRVRVMDFGLARGDHRSNTSEEVTPLDKKGPSQLPVNTRLTRTGLMLGTPAYWAPERWDGADADFASDQYAWSVMAWEILYGRRPYPEDNPHELAEAARAGRPVSTASGRRVPRWLRRVVSRGLATKPRDRYPAMSDLLKDLRSGPRRRLIATGLIALLFIAGGTLATQQLVQRIAINACDAEAHGMITDVWGEGARAGLREGLARTGAGFAHETADRVMPWLDDYTAALERAESTICRQRNVDHEWSPALIVEAGQCLSERRMYLEALLNTLAAATNRPEHRGMVASAGMAIASLPGIDSCLDEIQLKGRPRAPAEQNPEIQRIRGLIAQASALAVVGNDTGALESAESAQRAADSLAWPPLRAEATYRRGMIQMSLANFVGAEATLFESYLLAGESVNDELFADAASSLGFLVGYHQGRYQEGIYLGKVAETWLKRTGTSRDSLRWASVLNNLGSVLQEEGQLAEANDYYRRALAIAEQAMGPKHPSLVRYMAHLAWGYYAAGEHDAALALVDRGKEIVRDTLGAEHPEGNSLLSLEATITKAKGDMAGAIVLHKTVVARREAAFGLEHPHVATDLTNLGITYEEAGDYPNAVSCHERALAIRRKAHGGRHPNVARSLSNLGAALHGLGDDERAIKLNEEALALSESLYGPGHQTLANPLNTLMILHSSLGHHDEARAAGERALSIMSKHSGPDHIDVAAILTNLSWEFYETGETQRAVESLRRALAIRESTLGPDDPALVRTLNTLGLILAKNGEEDLARPVLERSLGILDDTPSPPPAMRAVAQYALAIALWPHPEKRRPALELAAAALTVFREGGPSLADEATMVEAWLRDHGDTPTAW